ncbi:hypothetical protein [Tenacibaculum soleae]|uniref:hypothetical protein n=1 Tax=Tenacibaculum soleae TaxID=447689 RepID=UPI003AB4A9BE
MTLYNKHISILITILIFISLKINAQEIRVIDKKGTIQTVNNNLVTTSPTFPSNPVEGDIWFDTTNSLIRIFDPSLPLPITNQWATITSTATSSNIYTTDDTLTANRFLNGGTNNLRFSNLGRFDIDNVNYINLESTGFFDIRAISGINLRNSNTIVHENLSVVKSYIDSSGDVGTNGQILSSTATGTDWIDNAALNNWLITGNTGTTAANFLGTIDLQDFVIRTNNTERLRVTNDRSQLRINQAPIFNNHPLVIRANGVDVLAFQDASGTPRWHWNILGNGLNFVESNIIGGDYRLFLENGGDIGINTNNPTERLDVNGKLKIRDITTVTTNNEILTVTNTGVVEKKELIATETDNQIITGANGGVYLGPTVYTGSFIINASGAKIITGIPFQPSQITFVAHANIESLNIDADNGVGNNNSGINNSFGSMNGFVRNDGATNTQQVIYVGGSGNSINDISRYASSTNCIGVRYGNQNGDSLGRITASLTTFNPNGFTLNVSRTANASNENLVVLFTAYK